MIRDYVVSRNNVKLLRSFAIEQSSKLWPDKRSVVAHAVDVHLHDVIDNVADQYATWAPSPENLAEINIEIWKRLRPRIENTLKGAQIQQEDAIKTLALDRDFATRHIDGPPDLNVSERSFHFLEEKYMNTWK
jgi:hypothetical protein